MEIPVEQAKTANRVAGFMNGNAILDIESATEELPRRDVDAVDEPDSLNGICAEDWSWIRGQIHYWGHGQLDDEDLTQEFYLHLLRYDRLQKVCELNGSRHAFLRKALHHFLLNHYDRRTAQKRGGRVTFVSWEEYVGDQWEAEVEVELPVTSELNCGMRSAVIQVESVLRTLREEARLAGRLASFQVLEPFLWCRTKPGIYRQAADLGMTEVALRVEMHRLRRRFGKLLWARVTSMVEDGQNADEEVRRILRVWAAED